MSKSIASLPPGFFQKYLKGQDQEVKQNAYKALGVFSESTVNLSKPKNSRIPLYTNNL
jgi:hypothetical protein